MPPKKKGAKKGKAADWGDSGDDLDPLAAGAVAGAGSDGGSDVAVAPPPLSRAKKTKPKKPAPTAASAFALLGDDDDDGAGSDPPAPSDDDDAAAPSPPRRGSSGAAGFAALLGDEGEENEEDEEDEPPTGLVACVILDVTPHPSADRLRVVQVDAGGAAPVVVVTNSPLAVPGVAAVLAPAGVTTPGTAIPIKTAAVRGVESGGMLCSGADAGWTPDADGVLALLPAAATTPGAPVGRTPPEGALFGTAAEKAGRKAAKKAAAAAALAALAAEGEGGDAAREPAAPLLTKKKKKKSTADLGAAFAALEAEAAAADEAAGETTATTTTAAKKKKKKSTADLGALLASLEEEGAAAPPPPPPAAAGPLEPTGDAEIDALLASIENPAVPAPGAAGGGGKKKKKKKGAVGGGGAAVDDDVDAALAALGLNAPAPPAPDAPSLPPAPSATPSADGGGAGGGELTAAQKKKLKKKQKEKAKKAGGGDDDDGAAAAAVEAAAADAAAAAAKPAAGGKAPSAAVRRMQEALERRQAAEAAARAEAEAAAAAEEAALAAAEAEEARKRADAEARKERQRERRAELKRAGLLLTGKAKKEAERLAAVREQFLRSAGGGVPGEGDGGDGASARPKKAVYEKKKKRATVEGEATASASVEAEPAPAPAPAPEAVPPAAAPPSPPPPASPSSASDAAADAWDEMDLDAVAAPVAAPFAGEDEEAETSDDGGGGGAPPPAPAAAARATSNGRPAPAAPAAADDASSTEYSESEDDDDESESDDESDDGSDASSDDSDAARAAAAAALLAASKRRRAARFAAAAARSASSAELRSPICCILGHVDTGKTKLLDNVRRTSVQEGEAGGITQQIGATYIPADALARRTAPLRGDGAPVDVMPGLQLPGLLVIDTPGHESFSNLRSRGSGLCDIAVLVVDLMHGLEPQTLESIGLLKARKTPFIVALNKIDRLFDWTPTPDAGFRAALAAQPPHVVSEFEKRLAAATLALNEQGLNVALYDENPDPRKYVSVVPTSAVTGEGVPDLLAVLVSLTQTMMAGRLTYVDETQCTVLEVKVIEGLGTTVDVVLVNGTLREGDTIVACGLGGPLTTTVRSLLTPHPLKELRVKGSYQHHKSVRAAQGVKICAHGLESAVAGTQLLVLQPGDNIEGLKLEVMEDMQDIFASVDRTGEGVCAQASTLGSLEALLEFLRSPAVAIPVSGIAIGPVHKRDVMRASVMLEKGRKKYACVLAFDVPVTKEARELADELGVRVFTADIIYHLFDQFTAYLRKTKDDEAAAARASAAFPCVLKIMPTCVFNKKDPIVLGVEVEEGVAAVGTPLCVPSQGGLDLGRIASLELNHKSVDKAHKGDSVAMKIESTCAVESARMFGRHFTADDRLVSRVTRRSIDVLKTHFRDELARDDWALVVKLKKLFGID